MSLWFLPSITNSVLSCLHCTSLHSLTYGEILKIFHERKAWSYSSSRRNRMLVNSTRWEGRGKMDMAGMHQAAHSEAQSVSLAPPQSQFCYRFFTRGRWLVIILISVGKNHANVSTGTCFVSDLYISIHHLQGLFMDRFFTTILSVECKMFMSELFWSDLELVDQAFSNSQSGTFWCGSQINSPININLSGEPEFVGGR